MTMSLVEALVASLYRSFHNSLASECPSHEKDLDKIFKILYKGFWRLILATCSWVIWVTKIACFSQIGLKSHIVFKNFLVFPRITCTHFVIFASPSPKTSIVTHKTSIFFFNPSSIFKKRYGFSLIFTVFQVSSPCFLGFCVYVEILKYGCWIWSVWRFDKYDIWVLLVL